MASEPTPPPFEPMVIVTRVTTRRPEWKAHRNIGHARNALSVAYGYGHREIWQHDGAEWRLVEKR